MKELSIEEKAKRYDRAIEKARNIVNSINVGLIGKDSFEAVFPELAESEDERIGKDIVAAVETYGDFTQGRKEEIYAWLEKQSKASKVEETMREIEEKAKAFTEAHKGETTEEILAQMKGELMPTLGKEGERDFDIIRGIIYNSCNAEDASRLIDWLKSLKDRVQPQPKQEWNEEDINMIDWLIRCCEKEHEELCNDKYGHQDIVSDLKRDCRKKWGWLESLKNRVAPQKQWKPSDEQLDSLYDVLNPCDGFNREVLESLYVQLKKLREE